MITPLSKGPTRKQAKAKRDRAEARVKREVRARCVERDGQCFIGARLDVEVKGLGGYMQRCSIGSEGRISPHIAAAEHAAKRQRSVTLRLGLVWRALGITGSKNLA